jgi:hypothetical protein
MAHLSEAIPTPPPNPGHVWGLLGTADRTQWRWEAPTRRPAKKEGAAPGLPAWLSEWDTTSQEGTAENLQQERRLADGAPSVEEEVRHFREMIRSESDPEMQIADFNQRFKQSLTLGLVPGDTLAFALQQVTDALRGASKHPEVAQARCLAFYNAVWDGISASKVLRLVDFKGEVISEFADLLSCLPSTNGAQILAHRIICSASISQLQRMEHAIISLVKAWSRSWLEAPWIGDSRSIIRAAEGFVIAAKSKLVDAQNLAVALEKRSRSETDFTTAREAVSAVNNATIQALDSIAKAEQITSPFRASAKLLAEALDHIPRDLFPRIASSCSEIVMMASSARPKHRQTIRYYWLSTMAQINKVDTELFLQTWRKVEGQDSIRENEASDLILSHWVSQGCVKNAAGVRNSFEATAQRAGQEDFASLLFALDKHRENSLTRTRELFLLLDRLGKYKRVYKILSRMNDMGLKVPMTCLGRSIDTMSSYDARLALRTFHLHKAMLLGDRRVRLDWIPNFVIALINDRSITPKQIWELLRIPIYEDLPRSQRHFQPTPLSPTMIDLVHKMTLAFAHSEARPARVAVRNVLQCLYHLRVHRAPIGQEVSRAMSRVGITEDINNGRWVRDERLRYTLDLVNKVEGKDVAEKVDATVVNWRLYLSEKEARRKREGNVLRVGPID